MTHVIRSPSMTLSTPSSATSEDGNVTSPSPKNARGTTAHSGSGHGAATLSSSTYNVDLELAAGDVLVVAFAYILRMSEKGIPLPFRVPPTVAYEHHFPRAWYAMAGDGDDADLTEGGQEPAALQRKPARSCGSKAIVSSFADRRLPRHVRAMLRSYAAGDNADFSRSAPPASGAATSAQALPPGIICGHLVCRDRSTGALITRCLDEVTLREVTVAAPEQCILSKYLPPDAHSNDRNDVLFATFTPTVFSLERRVNRHHDCDVRTPIDARGDVETPENSVEATAPPMLVQSAREALQKFVWFIEATEGRAVLLLRAALKYRRGCIWFLWADRIQISQKPPIDQQPRFGRIRVAPLLAPAKADVTDVDKVWDGVNADLERRQAQLERTRHEGPANRLWSGVREPNAALRPYGAWPSFCEIKVPSAEVIAAAERKYLLLTAHGGTRAASAMDRSRPPKALRMKLVTPTPQGVPLEDDERRMESLAIAKPVALMDPVELDQFWGAFDDAVAAAVQRATTLDAPPSRPDSASAVSPRDALNSSLVAAAQTTSSQRSAVAPPLPAHMGRRMSTSSNVSSIMSSALMRSVHHRPERAVADVRLRACREHQLSTSIDKHLELLAADFHVRPEAAWGYRDASPPRRDARNPSGSTVTGTAGQSGRNNTRAGTRPMSAAGLPPVAKPLPVASAGVDNDVPATPRTAALEAAMYEQYNAALGRSRGLDQLAGDAARPDVEVSVECHEAEGGWANAFDAAELQRQRCRIHPRDPAILLCEARDPKAALKQLKALKTLRARKSEVPT
jgi:hypothetical protein